MSRSCQYLQDNVLSLCIPVEELQVGWNLSKQPWVRLFGGFQRAISVSDDHEEGQVKQCWHVLVMNVMDLHLYLTRVKHPRSNSTVLPR
jgi:hypothetical protein